MLTIVAHSIDQNLIELELAGRIGAAEASLLEGEFQCLSGDGTRLVLDLKGIRFIDRTGLALLEQWSSKGLRWRGGSTFIQKLLTANGLKGGL
jgi:anti-anti-sigma regulatory factor